MYREELSIVHWYSYSRHNLNLITRKHQTDSDWGAFTEQLAHTLQYFQCRVIQRSVRHCSRLRAERDMMTEKNACSSVFFYYKDILGTTDKIFIRSVDEIIENFQCWLPDLIIILWLYKKSLFLGNTYWIIRGKGAWFGISHKHNQGEREEKGNTVKC